MKETELVFTNIWSEHKAGVPRLLSVLLHIALVIVAIIPGASSIKPLPKGITFIGLQFPTRLVLPPSDEPGGGGGGKRSPTPASQGRLPRASDKQLVPPDPEPPKNVDPTLIVEPTVVANLPTLPELKLLALGDPNGIPGPPSAGPGDDNGIGTGVGGGVGSRIGPGVGDDEGRGSGDISIRGGITEPVLVTQIIPEYSEEARKARFQGTVVLATWVREDGTVQVNRVMRGVGYGLDQKAIEAVLQWRFKPARRNGKPVTVALNVEVNFNLR